MSQTGFRSTGMTNVGTVARIEPPGPTSVRPDDKLSEIRDHPLPTATPPRVSLTLNPGYGAPAWLQIAPFAAVFLVFFLVPLALTVMVSFWDYNEYQILPAFTVRSYVEIFEGCLDRLPDLCVTLKTYLSTLKFCVAVWLITLVVGFFIAFFLAFHVRSATLQIALFF